MNRQPPIVVPSSSCGNFVIKFLMPMARTLLLPALLLAVLPALAQRHIEVGIAPGTTHFHGDLGNFKGAVQWNSFRSGMQITVRDFLNNPKRYVTRAVSPEFRMGWLRVGYDETAMVPGRAVNELRNYRRGLSFRNDLVGASGHLVLNAYREPYQPLFQQRFFMYFHVGVGVYYGRPKADLFLGDMDIANRYHFWSDGTVRNAPPGTPDAQVIEKDGVYETDLYSWMTESGRIGSEGRAMKDPSPWHVAVPMGFGIRYMVTKQISVGAEFSYYMFTSDRVDDVSDRYATYAEIEAAYPNDPVRQELARYISDPTGLGTNGTESIITSPRGNPGLLDAVSFINLEVSYKFKRKPSRRSFVSL
jgi:hypothetical protein